MSERKQRETLLSVVIPAFNNQSLLDQCLATIVKQTVRADETIVVDDGSSPPLRTPPWIRKIRIERKAKHRGSSAAKNVGADMAYGRYLCFIDAEMLLMPDTFASLLAAHDSWEAERGPKLLLNVMRISLPVRVSPDETDDMRTFIKYARRCEWIDRRAEDLTVPVACYEQNVGLIRKDFFHSLGGYDEETFESWGFNNQDLDLRVAEAGGHVTSSIPGYEDASRRLVCFHNFHDPPIDKERAKREFTSKWGEEFCPAMMRERLDACRQS